MLENLRKMIDEENEYDEMVELMVEATDSSIADSFIEEDGEAEIPESELNKILNNIPAYDEEEALNKKIKKITECYIPEDESLLESRQFAKDQFGKFLIFNVSTKPIVDLIHYTTQLEKAVKSDLEIAEDAKDIKFIKLKFKWCVNAIRKFVGKALDTRSSETDDIIKELDQMIKDREAEIKASKN